eukprot:11203661-Prorocentrum_lima.AAC.1
MQSAFEFGVGELRDQEPKPGVNEAEMRRFCLQTAPAAPSPEEAKARSKRATTWWKESSRIRMLDRARGIFRTSFT